MVEGDSGQLQQVILNIFQNARQAIHATKEKGTFTVKTEQYGHEAQVMEAHIVFENSGTPIPLDHLEKIFDPFFTTKKFGEGTGLGLSLSFGIIKEHGGRIWVENMEEGVCFHIVLPLASPALKTGDEGIDAVSEERFFDADFLNGLRILLVEDDFKFRTCLVILLEEYGAIVSQAGNGFEAIGQLNSEKMDVILSDLKMPEMDGLALCRWLEKTRPEYLRKMIFLTGIVEDDLEVFCLKRKVPILMKPVDKARLMQTLKTVCDGGI